MSGQSHRYLRGGLVAGAALAALLAFSAGVAHASTTPRDAIEGSRTASGPALDAAAPAADPVLPRDDEDDRSKERGNKDKDNRSKDDRSRDDARKPTPAATATATEAAAASNLAICHRTGVDVVPYLLLVVDDRAVKAHRDGHDGDIVPAPATGCPGPASSLNTSASTAADPSRAQPPSAPPAAAAAQPPVRPTTVLAIAGQFEARGLDAKILGTGATQRWIPVPGAVVEIDGVPFELYNLGTAEAVQKVLSSLRMYGGDVDIPAGMGIWAPGAYLVVLPPGAGTPEVAAAVNEALDPVSQIASPGVGSVDRLAAQPPESTVAGAPPADAAAPGPARQSDVVAASLDRDSQSATLLDVATDAVPWLLFGVLLAGGAGALAVQRRA